MASRQSDLILRQIRKLAGPPRRHPIPPPLVGGGQEGGKAEVSDRELLRRFAARHDEAAFETLVGRHGPMVLRMCQRVLANPHDAEDVFQAAFLILARQAGSRRWHESIASWLYQVAYHLALNARLAAARRSAHEKKARSRPPADPLAELTGRELLALLDEELARLPEKYRAPLVLCHLEGQTRDEAAQRLACRLGTLKSRLERGRELLRKSLVRRGLTLTAALFADLLSQSVSPAAVPAGLVHATAQAALVPLGVKSASGVISAPVAALVQTWLRAMVMTKVKLALVLLMVGAAIAGTGLLAQQAIAPKEKEPAAEADRQTVTKNVNQPKPAKEVQARTDLYGDPLPAAAVARLGTVRFRMRQWGSASIALSPDGKTLATAGKFISVWDLATGKELLQFATPVREVIFADEGKALVGAGYDGNVHVWDAATGKELRRFSGHERRLNSVVYAPKDRLVISSGAGKIIRVWNYDTGRLIRTLNEDANEGASEDANVYLALSAEGEMLASVSIGTVNATVNGAASSTVSSTVRLWDFRAGKELRVLYRSHRNTTGLCLSHDGRMLMTSEENHKGNVAQSLARLWDTATGKEIRQLKGAFGVIGAAVFTRDGKTLITGECYGGPLRYWDTETGEQIRRYEKQGDCFRDLDLTRDEKLLVSFGYDSKIFIWNAETGEPIDRDQGHEARGSAVAYSPDGRLVATVALGGPVRIWDPRTGKQTRTIDLTAGPKRFVRDQFDKPNRIEFSSLGKLLVSCDNLPYGQFVSVSDSIAGKELYRRNGSYGTFSPDGKLVASAETGPNESGVIRLYEAETGKLVRELRGHTSKIGAIAFFPDGKTLVSQGILSASLDLRNDSGILRYWDVATGKQMKTSEPSGYDGLGIFSPDGRSKVLGGEVWEAASRQQRAKLPNFPMDPVPFIYTMAFSPDGRMLAGAGDPSGTIRLWELPSCKEIGRFHGHRGKIVSLAFAPDSKNLASGSWDTSVLIWDVTPFRGQREPVPLESDKLQPLWRDLESNAETAYRAFAELARSPKQAIGLMEEHLHPAPALDQKELDRLLSDLDSNQFAVREKASAALESVGTRVEPTLRKALAGKPSAELRRRIDALMEKIQAPIPPPKEVREIRAVEILEYLAAPGAEATGFTTGADATRFAAFSLLKKLAAGAPEARLTQEAKASLERLDKRPK